MTQPSLFNRAAPTIARARRKGHAGADRAAAAAGEAWMEAAGHAVINWAAWEHGLHASWLMEDAREAVAHRLPAPPDGRAWGAVCRRLQRAGRIRAAGYAPARSSNGSAKVLWEVVR